MSVDRLQSTVREMVELLVSGDYDLLIRRCVRSRLSSRDLAAVIREYGRRPITPPVDAYLALDAVALKDAATSTWSVRAPLWTEEEGRSDLTLELTIELAPQKQSLVELDDLHVL